MPVRDVAGFPTYWQSFGQGGQGALMIHCSLAQSGAWMGLAKRLDDLLTMTAFDLPGHGKSADWDGRGEIQKVTTDIAAGFLDSPAVIIGHSFGATVALRLAVERPEFVQGLVLIEPVLFAVLCRDDPDQARALDAELQDFTEAMTADKPEEAAREFTRIWGDGTPWAAIPDPVRKKLATQMPLIGAAQPALYNDIGNTVDRAPGINVPVLLIEGGNSPPAIAAINAGLAARIPGAERVVIDGAGHMVPLSHPDPVADALRGFLVANGLAGQSAPA